MTWNIYDRPCDSGNYSTQRALLSSPTGDDLAVAFLVGYNALQAACW